MLYYYYYYYYYYDSSLMCQPQVGTKTLKASLTHKTLRREIVSIAESLRNRQNNINLIATSAVSETVEKKHTYIYRPTHCSLTITIAIHTKSQIPLR